ncbi:hypothetical protein D3C71_1923630 [compost metagenome]
MQNHCLLEGGSFIKAAALIHCCCKSRQMPGHFLPLLQGKGSHQHCTEDNTRGEQDENKQKKGEMLLHIRTQRMSG